MQRVINTPLSYDEEEEKITMMGGACMVMSEEELIHKSRLSYSGICFLSLLLLHFFCFHLPFELEIWLFLSLCFFSFCLSLCFFSFCLSPRPGKQNKTKPYGLHFAIIYINY